MAMKRTRNTFTAEEAVGAAKKIASGVVDIMDDVLNQRSLAKKDNIKDMIESIDEICNKFSFAAKRDSNLYHDLSMLKSQLASAEQITDLVTMRSYMMECSRFCERVILIMMEIVESPERSKLFQREAG